MKIAYLITLLVFLSYQNGQIQNASSMETQRKTSIVEPLKNDDNIAIQYKTDEFNVAIFPKEYSEFLPEKRFTPSKQDVDKAENALKTKLKVINKDRVNQSSSPLIDENLKNTKDSISVVLMKTVKNTFLSILFGQKMRKTMDGLWAWC